MISPFGRMFGFAALIAALSLASATVAGDADKNWFVRCEGAFNLCGYADRASMRTVIPARFEMARLFSEGLAAVRVKGRFGYIDETGTLVIAPRFVEAGAFRGGYAEVRIDGASGIIDRHGQLVVPAAFQRIIPLAGEVFIAQPLPARSPSTLFEPNFSSEAGDGFYFATDGLGLYRRGRGWVTTQDLSFALLDRSRRDLIWAGRRGAAGFDIWGLMRSDGSWQVTPRFSHVQQLVEGRAIVRGNGHRSIREDARSDDDLWGAVDGRGRLKVPLKFAYLSYWQNGFGRATEGPPHSATGAEQHRREAMVGVDGSLLAGRYFDQVDRDTDGLPRARVGDHWFGVDRGGRLIPELPEGRIVLRCSQGLLLRQHGAKIEFSHPWRDAPLGLFDEGYYRQTNCSDAVPVHSGTRWGFVTQDGRYLGGKAGFDNIYGFTGDHAAVELDGKWGIIDLQGKFTVEPRFRTLRPERGAFLAEGDGAPRWIDGEGKPLAQPPVAAPDRSDLLRCDGGLILFDHDGLWGLRESGGEIVIAPQYRALSCFRNGVSWTARADRRGWWPIGPDGADHPTLACREQFYFVEASDSFPEKFAADSFESSVAWNRAYLDYASNRRREPPKWTSSRNGQPPWAPTTKGL
ncbi:MAG: hypothetical protein JWL96_1015 [Sphingomonas bacterium]|uniref:WG repeat-containing protein n=1 Tax=Sphingomonas bacterium TaxID=1895847 RepID=UPI00262F28D2|nr:WG repeat-containing protein [Sphingomonas bacterium]MDB5708945.1 hypothetical protein [Sphingomonas bacterium]